MPISPATVAEILRLWQQGSLLLDAHRLEWSMVQRCHERCAAEASAASNVDARPVTGVATTHEGQLAFLPFEQFMAAVRLLLLTDRPLLHEGLQLVAPASWFVGYSSGEGSGTGGFLVPTRGARGSPQCVLCGSRVLPKRSQYASRLLLTQCK